MKPPSVPHRDRSDGRGGGRRLTLHSPLMPRPWLLAFASVARSRTPRARAPIQPRAPAYTGRLPVRPSAAATPCVVMAVGDEPANEKGRGRSRPDRAADRLFSGWNRSPIRGTNAHASTARFRSHARRSRRSSCSARERARRGLSATVLPLVEAWGFAARCRCAHPRATTSSRARARGRLPRSRGPRRGQGAARRGVRRFGDRRQLGDGPDRARDRGAQYPDVLVDVAQWRAGRRADGGRWRVAVEWPDGGQGARRCSATDARSRRRGPPQGLDRRGGTAGHILDPRTGRPVTHDLASAPPDADGAWADALATTLMVLGPDAGRALVRERLAARLWCASPTRQFAEWSTPAFGRSSPLPAHPSRPSP